MRYQHFILLTFLSVFSSVSLHAESKRMFTEERIPSDAQTVAEYLDQDQFWFDIHDNPNLARIKSVALYFKGKAKTKEEKLQQYKLRTALMQKMQRNGMRVKDCIQCSKSKINLSGTSVQYRYGVDNNKQLRILGKKINVDAFLIWHAPLNPLINNMTLSLVNAKNNEVVWTDNFDIKPEPEELIKRELQHDGTAITAGYINGQGMDYITDFSLRYYGGYTPETRTHYAFISDFFQGVNDEDGLSVSGYGLEARGLYTLENRMLSYYLGPGFQFASAKQRLTVRAGVEIAPFETKTFFDMGKIFLDAGIVYSGPIKLTSDSDNGSDEVTQGGVGLDLTIGIRFKNGLFGAF